MVKSIKKWIIAGLCCMTVASVSAICANNVSARAEGDNSVVWSDVTLSETYAVGTEMTVPKKTLSVGGKEIVATATVEYPDGTCMQKDKIVLSMYGDYKVNYTAVEDGKVYTDSETFSVEYLSYAVSSNASSVSYGEFVTADGSKTHTGLSVSLSQYDKLTFDTIIDFENLTQDEALLSFFITPKAIGERDFKTMYITFTDIEDSTKKMDIRVNGNPDGYGYTATYFLAGVNGGPKKGWNHWSDVIFNDQNYMEWFYGQSIGHNWFGNESVGHNIISLFYESETACLYVEDVDHCNYLIADFDNPRYFDKLWSGFPSGKARMTISVNDMVGATANFFITDVNGADLSMPNAADTTLPVISVENATEEMPLAKLGGEYPVGKATAYDTQSGTLDVQTVVYFNYVSENNRVMVPIENGKFKTDRIGTYAIVYRATDDFGNMAEEVVWIKTADLDAPTISVDMPTESVTGEKIALPTPQVNGGSGEVTYVTSVIFNGEEEVVEGYFRPEAAGNYTVKYLVEDFIGQKVEKTYTVTVNNSDKWIVEEEPILPEYLISDSKYTLPTVYAAKYTDSGKDRVEATIYVTDKNERVAIASGEKYVPAIAENFGVATIEYVVGEETLLAYQIPVSLAKEMQANGRPKLEIENYFDISGATIEKTEEGMLITTVESDTQWTFINPIAASEMEVKLQMLAGKTKVDDLVVSFVDEKDPTVSVSAHFVKNGTGTKFTAGSNTFDLESGFTADSYNNEFVFGYKNDTFMVNGSSFEIGTYDNGLPFNGFPSNKCYVKVSTYGSEMGTQYIFKALNGISISSSTTDRVIPQITIIGKYGGAATYGTYFDIPAAMATSLLDANVEITMTVETPSGEIALDINGVALKNVDPSKVYTIHLSEYGQYLVKYEAVDTFNVRPNDQTFNYAIFVVDDIAPEIHLDGTVSSTAKVGDILVIPKYTVTDNKSSAETLKVSNFVFTNTGVCIRLDEGVRGVKATAAGVWKLCIYAMDEAGNIQFVTYEVTVS